MESLVNSDYIDEVNQPLLTQMIHIIGETNDPYNLSNLSDSPNATDSNRSPFSLLQLVNMLILFFRFVCTNQLGLMKKKMAFKLSLSKKIIFCHLIFLCILILFSTLDSII